MIDIGDTVEPTFFSRFECKYLVDPILLPDMREHLKPFTRPDDFAALREGYRYPICSLYLDSDDLRLYYQTVGGEKNRFKLRVRTYSDEPSTPAYLEVKTKVNTVVHKRRAGLRREQVDTLLRGRALDALGDLPHGKAADVAFFDNHVQRIRARPVVRVKYMREAYQGTGNEPSRLTVDTDLMHAVTLEGDLGHESGRWVSTPVDGTIIEIKFTERLPFWAQEFIRTFHLHQCPVPKYCLSVDHMMMGGREAPLALAGLTLPPRRI